MAQVMRYTGPDIKFGAKLIPSGVLFYYDEPSGDLLIAGTDKAQLALPQVLTSLQKNSETTNEDPLILWPKTYEKIAKRAPKVTGHDDREPVDTPVTRKWHPRMVNAIGSDSDVVYKEIHYSAERPVSSGVTLKKVDMSHIPKRERIEYNQFDAKAIRPIAAKYDIDITGMGPMSDVDLALIGEEVLPRLGLRKGLPANRVYVAQSQITGTSIYNMNSGGAAYGLVIVNPDQLSKLLGGYNTASLGQALTHELAHYIDRNVVRNTARVEFDRACRTTSKRKLHPDQGADPYRFAKEQFAILAELLVWGQSVRGAYALNGVDVVARYFYNNWIPDEDMEDTAYYVQ